MTPEHRDVLIRLHNEVYGAAHAAAGSVLTSAYGYQPAAVIAEALRAALAPPPTCGMCKWGVEVFTEHAPPDEVFCQRFSGRRKRDDGCIKGYTPTEPTR